MSGAQIAAEVAAALQEVARDVGDGEFLVTILTSWVCGRLMKPFVIPSVWVVTLNAWRWLIISVGLIPL
jgi:hypothetical protein